MIKEGEPSSFLDSKHRLLSYGIIHAIFEVKMVEVTIKIDEKIYKDIEALAQNEKCTIDSEFEKAAILLTQKKKLVSTLMHETCDEFDDIVFYMWMMSLKFIKSQ